MFTFNTNENYKKKSQKEQTFSDDSVSDISYDNSLAVNSAHEANKTPDVYDELLAEPSLRTTVGRNNYNQPLSHEKTLPDLKNRTAPPLQQPIDSANVRNYTAPDSLPPYSAPLNEKNQSKLHPRFAQGMMNELFPSAGPQRMKALYSVSQKALDDVVGEYFESEMRPIFEKNKVKMYNRAQDARMTYARIPTMSISMARREEDPMKVVEETMNSVDYDKLREFVKPIAAYGGYDADEYIEQFVMPSLRNKMVNDFVEEGKPKSHAEYVARTSLNNSLVNKAMNIGAPKSHFMLENERLSRFDASRLDNILSGVGGLMLDAPLFSGIGAAASGVVGRATSLATNRLASRIYSYGAAEGMSKGYASLMAERAIMNNLSSRIAQSAMVQGLTLGTYDVSHSIADDIIYNNRIDTRKAADAFTHGFLTGGVAGGIGRRMNDAIKLRGLTGGKKMLASTGVLSAESAVFTAATQADKHAHDVKIEPIDILNDFTDAFATLGIMKMTHWRPQGVKDKLNSDGKIKEKLKLSNSEKVELRELNIEPEEFMAAVERELNLPSFGSGSTNEAIAEKYLKLMSSKEVSATTKSKLMYLIENKITSTPPVAFDFAVDKRANGSWALTTYDFNGNRIERRLFNNSSNLKSHMLVERSNIRKNRIATFEGELLRGLDSQNLLRQAGIYAQEQGIATDNIATIMYKHAKNETLSAQEKQIMDDILERAAYDETGMVQYLSDMRRDIEQKNGLEEGALLVNIDKPFYLCSSAENKALDDYEILVRTEVEMLKQGADAERSAQMKELGSTSSFAGMDNEQVKSSEVEDYYSRHPQKESAAGNGKYGDKLIEVEESDEPNIVWSYNGVENTMSEIAAYKNIALEMAKKYNVGIDFIENETQIPRPLPGDKPQVAEYNNKVRALGWVDSKGEITLNLPNISSREELEKTFVHEVVAHSGLSKLFGYHFNTFLEEVLRKSAGDARANINKIGGEYKGADNFYKLDEYLARLSERLVTDSKQSSALVGIKDFMRNSLIRMNLYTGRNRRILESDLMSLLRQHAKYMRKGTEPSRYRGKVFKLFTAGNQEQATYYNREEYENLVRQHLADGTFFKNTPAALYNSKALRHYKLMPEEMQKSFRKRWNVTDEDIRREIPDNSYRFIGKKGAENQAYYEGREDKDNSLAEAIEMEKQGVLPARIRMDTGWERGLDGEWRMEMPDNRTSVRDLLLKALYVKNEKLAHAYNNLKQIPQDAWGYDEQMLWKRIRNEGSDYFNNAKLSDILHDPSFATSYPELMKLPLEFVNNPKVPIRYDNKGKKILLDRSFFLYPENAEYLTGVLQTVIQDYEGFSKAVSMNLFGINSKLEKSYREAMKIIDGLERTRESIPNFDKDESIDKVFQRNYHFTPKEFKEKFPSLDEYIIYKLTGKEMAFSGDVEMRNVITRRQLGDLYGRVVPTENTEDVPRSKQVVIKKLSDLKQYFNGPLDIIYDRLLNIHSDEPLMMEKVKERVRRANLTPLERSEFEWELEDYANQLLERLLNQFKPKNDFGYSKHKEYMNEMKRRRENRTVDNGKDEYFKNKDIIKKFLEEYENPDPEDIN